MTEVLQEPPEEVVGAPEEAETPEQAPESEVAPSAEDVEERLGGLERRVEQLQEKITENLSKLASLSDK